MAVVAASGPSLCQKDVDAAKGLPLIVVNDAYRLAPWADVLYACDERWWEAKAPEFGGECWSSTDDNPDGTNHKDDALVDRFRLNLVRGKPGIGYSTDPRHIHYGDNSGHQAVNLAILFGATRILLLGFDMKGKAHFFGDHPTNWPGPGDYRVYADKFKAPPEGVEIINCTPGSAIKAYPFATIGECIRSAA